MIRGFGMGKIASLIFGALALLFLETMKRENAARAARKEQHA